jgi:PKD repeat protein
MKFDTTRVRFISATTNPSLLLMTITYTPPVGGTQGQLLFSWDGGSNFSLPDGSILANLTFSYTSGTGILNWKYNYGSVCRYQRYISGTPVTLNDDPKYLFYRNGGISDRGAPVTFVPAIPIAAPGAVSIPVTVNDFTGIGAITLYLEYDPAVITYQNSFTKNSVFGSTFQVGNNPGQGGKMLIIIQWYGNPVSLPNGASLCTLDFHYISITGASSALSWYDNGPSCEYADVSTALIDLPTADFYHNGVVGPPVVTDFSAGNLTPLKNETVVFTDLTTGSPDTWHWSFDKPGAVFTNGTSPSSQHPMVLFSGGGLYTVTLVASNSYFNDTEVKTGYIRAGSPGLWSGETSVAWNTLTNWDNHLVPDSTTEVFIPPSAGNWPVFDGDFIIGVHCSKLVLNGPTSQLTITGDFIIP